MSFKLLYKFNMLYSHIIYMQLHTYTCINTTTLWRRATQSFRKIYLSLYWKGSKGLLKVLLWEGVGDRTELQHIDPRSYGHQCCVFLVLQGCSTRGLGAHFAGYWLSLPHLVTNGSDLQTRLQTNWLPVSPSYIIVQSPSQYIPMTGYRDMSLPPSLEWHVWSSSSGNNGHAVHRSLSFDVSVCECTAGFYLVPYCQPSPTMPMEYATSASLEWHVWPGRKSIYNKCSSLFCSSTWCYKVLLSVANMFHQLSEQTNVDVFPCHLLVWNDLDYVIQVFSQTRSSSRLVLMFLIIKKAYDFFQGEEGMLLVTLRQLTRERKEF